MRHAFSAGMRAVHGAKGVAHVKVRQLGERLCKLGVVLLFFWVKAQVLQQQHVARPGIVNRAQHLGADALLQRNNPNALDPLLREAGKALRQQG